MPAQAGSMASGQQKQVYFRFRKAGVAEELRKTFLLGRNLPFAIWLKRREGPLVNKNRGSQSSLLS